VIKNTSKSGQQNQLPSKSTTPIKKGKRNLPDGFGCFSVFSFANFNTRFD